jgi:hypothetical protein
MNGMDEWEGMEMECRNCDGFKRITNRAEKIRGKGVKTVKTLLIC